MSQWCEAFPLGVWRSDSNATIAPDVTVGETYQPGGGSSGRAGPMGIIVDHDAYDSQGSLHFFPKDGEVSH